MSEISRADKAKANWKCGRVDLPTEWVNAGMNITLSQMPPILGRVNNPKIENMIMDFKLMLAPMEGMTDAPFRTRCHKAGADLTFTEIARVSNLARGKRGELDKIHIPDATPTEIQLAGARISDFEKFLSKFKVPEEGGFRGFNLNLGCPSPSFLRQGAGAAMVKRVGRTGEIVKAVQKFGFSCSVKMRLGENKYEKEKGAYLNLIREVDASFFVVHPKTANQKSDEPEDESVYAKCVETGKKIVANGGISTKAQIDAYRADGLYGAMIGRAAMKNPEIFGMLK